MRGKVNENANFTPDTLFSQFETQLSETDLLQELAEVQGNYVSPRQALRIKMEPKMEAEDSEESESDKLSVD